MTEPSLLHRTGSVTVTVRDPNGAPLPDTAVIVEQVGHSFGFGNIAFDLINWIDAGAPEGPTDAQANGENVFGGAPASEGAHIAAHWLELFNHATLPFYWRSFEPEHGKPDTARMMKAATWLNERGVTVKGHPLLWHTLAPLWLMDVPLEDREAIIRDRITRDVTDFAGVIDLWDAINESVIMPVFTAEDNAITPLAQAKGRIDTIRLAFDTAREANPTARLVLNDFDLTVAYENVIEECLSAGIQIDAIGLQTHMHQGYRGEDQIHSVLERFSRFGLPIQMTETSLVSGEIMPADIKDLNDYQVDSWPSTPEGEARQADEMIRHYLTVLSHPLVESLTYWGITDSGSWLKAPIGILRADGSTKPSYDALKSRIKGDWWLAPTEHHTDDSGHLQVLGWGGTYRVRANGKAAEFTLTAGNSDDIAVTLA